MNRMKHWQSYLLIIICVAINLCGRYLASRVEIPFWFDSIGTLIAAFELGPVGGAITGALVNVCTSFYDLKNLAYILVSIAIGASAGLIFPKKKFDAFMIISAAVFAGFMAVIISTPLNMIFYDGKTGNVWGDSLIDMLSQSINVKWICSLLGEAFVDIPDKAVSVVMAVASATLVKRLLKKLGLTGKNINKESQGIQLLVLILLPIELLVFGTARVNAADFGADYAAIGYDTEDGLVSEELNAVAQTSDGYIWAGAYSGLYRYDGYKFEQVQLDERITNVMQLFADSEGNLWIGTNDSGVARYNTETEKIDFFSVDDGLSSNSIRAICEDAKGNVYVGTTGNLCVIGTDGQVTEFPEELYSVRTLSFDNMSDKNLIVGVTNGGELFFIEDNQLISISVMNDESGVYYGAAAAGDDDTFLVGTSADYAVRVKLLDDGTIREISRVTTNEISYFNRVMYSKENAGYFFCCENGLGFISDDGTVTDMSAEDFNSSVSDVIMDYQGNIWFASNKQGIERYSWNPFEDVFAKAGIERSVVNALLIKDTILYIGMDNGLVAHDLKNDRVIQVPDQQVFDGVRVRHLMADSKGNIWVSTYGQNGLIEITPSGETVFFNEETAGTVGGRFRSATELPDGRIFAASSTGLNYIEDGKVTATLSEEDGIGAQILSAVVDENGRIIAGSDGDGVYIIEDEKITSRIGEEQGLGSPVILKVVPCDGGYIFVTSNALYYFDGAKASKLNKFPYSNNYDVYIGENGEAWVSSSAGIFVVDKDALIRNEDISYALLNRSRGFYTSLTANATNAVMDSDIYLCCTDGVRKISLTDYNSFDNDYQIRVSRLWAEDDLISERDGKYVIPAISGRVRFDIAVLNFTLSNPLIHAFLDGTSDSGITCYQNEMQSLTYTNLPYGKYKLHVQVLDSGGDGVIREEIFNIEKESQLFERTYFKVYLIFVLVMFTFFLGWLLGRLRKSLSNMQTWKKEATTDPMTGLYNKATSKRELTQLCKTKKGILMMIDLDSFKLVNDLYGHDMGDKVLISFADIIRSCIRDTDLAGRMGGDEFIAFLQGTDDENAVAEKTRYINEQIVKVAKELMGDDMNIPLGASIGAVIAPDEGTDYEALFGLADKALYNVKQNGKHGYAMYRKANSKVNFSDATMATGLAGIRKILGERNIAKGAYTVDFNRLQAIYRTFVRMSKRTDVRVSIVQFVINPVSGNEISKDIVDTFLDILVNTLRANDVVALNGKNQAIVILTDINDDSEKAPIGRIMEKWDNIPGHNDYRVTYEIEAL
ncbi:diguanylate cyclase domain-containing protein [Butyrivibrio sp. AE3004]|uniref:diguanylate cyclase domain-containing protein n=1 Tax=Butyrivibrio sp. AE3004 TaxID=1506994 RepID=UPI0004944CC3|nr:diguanylate cyclase [Butyrivibrio sp. AE3004]